MSKIFRTLAITLICSATTTLLPVLPEHFCGTHEDAVLIISHEIAQQMPQKWCSYLFDENKGNERQWRLLFAIHNFLWQQRRSHDDIQNFIFEQAHCNVWEESLDPSLKYNAEIERFYEQFTANQDHYLYVLEETKLVIFGDPETTEEFDVNEEIQVPDAETLYTIALRCAADQTIIEHKQQALRAQIQHFKSRYAQTSLRLLATFIYRAIQNTTDLHTRSLSQSKL